ncbi:MAG: histone H1 [Euryarchaeota archaeon]|jgi:dihydroxyacetone kinase DhaKLM complex PTS-EIIA-like component DhaM|nr:histone H1 [Euryarchaeota archaeon]|tara:strand:- start:825 stop:1010 length:186 start_codon:yes stop_codon:yes gene_type:complete
MSVREMIQTMINDLVEIMDDAGKHDNGNNAAGTRVRKEMQSIKKIAQEVRIRVQNDRINKN